MLRAKRLQDLQLECRQRLTQARASALLPRLADSLFESPLLTIPEAQRILGVTYRGAQLNVVRLAEAGILRQMGESSCRRMFLAEGVLQALGVSVVSEQ